MEANDSESSVPTSAEEISSKRYSKRVRKPIKVFLPETTQSRSKKQIFNVNYEIVKSKGITINTKNLSFPISSNLASSKVIKKIMRNFATEQPDLKFAYFCEEKQSNF